MAYSGTVRESGWVPQLRTERHPDLQPYLEQYFSIVHELEGVGLYIVCEAGSEPQFDSCIKHFETLLGSVDAESADHAELCKSLRNHFVFAVGTEGFLEKHEDNIVRRFGHYSMAMKTDRWPYNPAWTGWFPAQEVRGFTTSCWRPRRMCATTEETFHTITEAFSRMAWQQAPYAVWGFGQHSVLGALMLWDIKEGGYEIERQNREQGGGYSWETAVNEYVHQCWLVKVAGHEALLSEPKQRVLEVIEGTPGFPRPSAGPHGLSDAVPRPSAGPHGLSDVVPSSSLRDFPKPRGVDRAALVNLLAALRAEYLERKGPEVGRFLKTYRGPNIMDVVDEVEDFLRRAPSDERESAVRRLEQTWLE